MRVPGGIVSPSEKVNGLSLTNLVALTARC